MSATGVYRAATEPVELTLDSEDFAGALILHSVSDDRIEFDLSVVGYYGGNPVGDIVRGEALPSDGGQLVYWGPEGPGDCQIFFFEVSSDLVELAQNGSCSDFGAFVDASGVYRR